MSIYDFAKAEFEKYYDSKLTVSEYKDVKVGSITKGTWVTVVEDVACRISQKQLNPASEGEAAKVTYVTKLYCDPAIEIKAGSKIFVTDPHGVTREYKRSSEGFSSYRTHQEIVIVRDVTA